MTKKFYREDSPLGNAVVYSEEAPENFTEITDPIEVKKEYIKIYNRRAKDGVALYNDIRADLVALYYNGVITVEASYQIELKLMEAKSFLLSGDWATAQHSLTQITIDEFYTQSIHDSIKVKVDDYVALNY